MIRVLRSLYKTRDWHHNMLRYYDDLLGQVRQTNAIQALEGIIETCQQAATYFSQRSQPPCQFTERPRLGMYERCILLCNSNVSLIMAINIL